MIRTSHPWGRAALSAVIVLGVVGCTTSTVDSVATPGSGSVMRVDRAAASTTLLDQALAADGPGCSAAAGVEGAVAWTGARGVADTDAGLPLTADTRFDTESVGKQFTATAILLLAQDGKLALTDPLAWHISGLPAWAEQVTVQDLMHHTSGLREVLGLLFGAGFTKDDAVRQPDALAEIAQIEELNFTPGSVFEYSNTNYVLLGEIVRIASGVALPEFLQERVFGPLGLTMSFGRDSVDNLPSGHTTTLGQLERTGAAWLLDGPGFIVTTPSELVRWADNYRTGAVGGPALIDQVTRDAHPTSSASNTDRYGAGVAVTADGTLVHGGLWAGMSSLFAVSPDRRAAIAITCNRDDIGQVLDDLGAGLTSIWFGPS